MLTKQDMDKIKILIDERLDIKLDEKLEEKLEEKLNEKLQFLPTKDEFYTAMDQIMGELKAMREEVEILAYRSSDHGDRIVVLEELHTDIKSHSHTVVN